jgi:hypothetical protein
LLSVTSYSLALLTKNTAVLLIPTLLLITFLSSYFRDENLKQADLKQAALKMAAFFLLVFIMTFPWYYTVYSTWGIPMFDPKQEGISKVHFWFVFAKSRPWYTYLISLPSMMPLYLFGYCRVLNLLRSKAQPRDLFLAVWFLSFFVFLTLITYFSEQLGPDSRYMLPAYPPLAILTAVQVLDFKRWLGSKVSAPAARFAILAALLLCSTWAYSLSDPSYYGHSNIYKNFMGMPW